MRVDSDIARYAPEHVELTMEEPDLYFARAKEIATREARQRASNAMLLFLERSETGRIYPKFECGSRQRPAWVVFAESRGGNLTVDVNEGEYTFIFLMM